ncbi:MAG TPA: transglycosylase domain-containing protein [Acidimicrobiales bacterium]|nr:transglycosylase domain-containing protein [Acidimicrobiales bacterium]
MALKAIAVALITSAAVPVTVAAVILGSFIFLPLPAHLPDPRPIEAGQVSRVYDQNGEEIGQFREFEQSIPVRPTDIPVHLKQAVISAEDKSFYRHGGVDVRGSVRALWVDLRGGGIRQGGSTITQQYVKNAYVGKERTVARKIREAIVASQLDRQVDKEEIIFQYLSTIYLGEGAYGVGAASETYFRKPVSRLTVSEGALLAGVIPAPSRYEPRGNPELAETKRRIVLDKMLEEGYLDEAAHAEAEAQVLKVLAPGEAPPEGPFTIVHPARSPPSKYPYFLDYVRKYLNARYGAKKVDTGGLRIQTTLDPLIQNQAERAVAEAIKGVPPTTDPDTGQPVPLEMALAAVEPQTGLVKALVGGQDFNAAGGQVNLALGGCLRPGPKNKIDVEATCWALDDEGKYVKGGGTGRQPGSSFKPFVLAAALEQGMLPTKVYSAPNSWRVPGCTAERGCVIENYEGASYGSADLATATRKSINTVYAQLVRDVGCPEAATMAKRLGIKTAYFSPSFNTCSGNYALGVIEVSPLDMASAYGVFAARGLRQDPTPVVQVVDAQGVVLEDNRRREPERVLDEGLADNLTGILEGVVTNGTGTRAKIGRPAAGKTGTAQNSQDSWFVGYTPTLSTAVWVGYRDRPLPMHGIKGCRVMTGGCLPAATWKNFMSSALADVPATEFNEPAPIKEVADRLSRAARTGIDPGDQRKPDETGPGGTYIVGPPPPVAVAPAPPTTTTTPPPADSG